MAGIGRLHVDRLRNLADVRLEPSDQINIVFGDNGSGKTSLLEAIHLLGLGRSFRDKRLDPIINHEADDCVVFARLNDDSTVGLQKTRRKGHALKLAGEKQSSWREVARRLPVQIINADSFALLEGGARARRRFLDWGVFHVEHRFVEHWRAASRCLAQRNRLLKMPDMDPREVEPWTRELAHHAEAMHQARDRYFRAFLPELQETSSLLLPGCDIEFEYTAGWDTAASLYERLQNSWARDRGYGTTRNGPHRADLRVRSGRFGAASILSRGQQKLLVSAMKIAQGRFLSKANGKTGVYLVDDLPAELDRVNRRRVCELLSSMANQVFFTCVELEDLQDMWAPSSAPAKFHVEHGRINSI